MTVSRGGWIEDDEEKKKLLLVRRGSNCEVFGKRGLTSLLAKSATNSSPGKHYEGQNWGTFVATRWGWRGGPVVAGLPWGGAGKP